MYGYRRHGHNESDEPAFTQPVLYRAIRSHPSAVEVYGRRLAEEGVVTEPEIEGMKAQFRASRCRDGRCRRLPAQQGRLVRRALGQARPRPGSPPRARTSCRTRPATSPGRSSGSTEAGSRDGHADRHHDRARVGNQAGKVDKLCADAREADEAGFATVWIPQIPNDFDAMTAVALMGRETSRMELGTAVVPLQSRHPVVLGQQALSTQAACRGRFTLGVGPSHHWVIDDMLGLPYERPAQVVEDYLDVFDAMFAGPGPVDVENERFRIHNPLDVTDLAVPVLLAALGPVMLRIAGSAPVARCCGWPTSA